MLKKLLTLITGAILLVLGFMFSLVLVAVVALLGLAIGGYVWWKTRGLRQQMRQATRQHAPGGEVIEGEAVVVEEHRASSNPVLPGTPSQQ